MKIRPLNLLDFYKSGHLPQYPLGTEIVYSNLTSRASRLEGVNHTVAFNYQYFVKEYLIEIWNKGFFNLPLEEVIAHYKRRMDNSLGKGVVPMDHIIELHNLGYLPLKVKALPEGTLVPLRVASMTIVNTKHKFFWLTNYVESILSNTIWKGITSATIANEYRKRFETHAEKTGYDKAIIDWQGHDFSFRGMSGVEDACTSGAGHLLSFTGTDSVPAIDFLEDYYNANSDLEMVGGSVPASEHSVQCMHYDFENENEEDYLRHMLKLYPSRIFSIVCDGFDFWKFFKILHKFKDEILARDGRVVIRPDSGKPVDIICGLTCYNFNSTRYDGYDLDGLANSAHTRNYQAFTYKGKYYEVLNKKAFDGQYREIDEAPVKGAYELLGDIFGYTTNHKGYKELSPKIGLIYGDAITLERQDQILTKLENKGFNASNLVLGIGSFTYEYVTRDTFGMAVKATYGVVNGVPRNIFKKPKTDRGLKNSAKGLLMVDYDSNGKIYMKEECTLEEENSGLLRTIFEDGQLIVDDSLSTIRKRLEENR